jgi:cell division protein FtsA
MEGAVELAEEVFHMPVRLGMPQHVQGLADVVRNPIHATGVGLLLYAKNRVESPYTGHPVGSGLRDVWERMKTWFQGNF